MARTRVRRDGTATGTGTVHVSAPYLVQVAECVRTMGGDVARWLADAGLDEQLLARDGATTKLADFEHLVRTAITMTAEPALGLLVGERLRATMHGMVGLAAMNAATVGDALEIVTRFLPLRMSALRLDVVLRGEEARLVLTETAPLGDALVPVLEAVTLALRNLLDAITMGACPSPRVALPFPPGPHADFARRLFGCSISWRARWAGLALPRGARALALPARDHAALVQATEMCQRELDRRATKDALGSRVRALLVEHRDGFPSLETTARTLHLGSRTLHRRLVAEGTSFQGILDEVRHGLAIGLLRAGAPLQEIAFRLGYSDIANFRRAFRRWEGTSPARFRAVRT